MLVSHVGLDGAEHIRLRLRKSGDGFATSALNLIPFAARQALPGIEYEWMRSFDAVAAAPTIYHLHGLWF